MLVPALPAHPQIPGQAAGRWDPQPLIPWAPRSTTTPKRELGATPAWGIAPCPCQDLLSIWKSLSLKLSPVNTCLLLTWLCCPGKFQLHFLLYVFFSFWLNFCCSPRAVPSCCPATTQGGSQSPLLQHCLPSLPAGSLSLTGHCSQRPVYDKEEDALPQGCLSLTALPPALPGLGSPSIKSSL